MADRTVEKPRRHKKLKIVLMALLLLLASGLFLYVSVYYHADESAWLSMQSDETVTVVETSYGWLFDGPSGDAALIFYPGGKVEETAYAPLLHELAARGMDACLVKMPFRLAILRENAALDVLEAHDYARWYIGGHSLGGVMAASFASGHAELLSGIVLLAAYPVEKIPDPLTEVLIVGSEDHVLSRDRLAEGRAFAPEHCIEHVIRGGNHAQFGSYGTQKGDGVPTIDAAEQIRETLDVILECLYPAD